MAFVHSTGVFQEAVPTVSDDFKKVTHFMFTGAIDRWFNKWSLYRA